MRILTLIDCYLPGFKHGGPIRTLANLVAQAPDDLEFLVLTRDRDLGDSVPYPGVPLDAWTEVGRAQVRYLPRWRERLVPLATRIRHSTPDVVYSNSLFSSMNVRALVARRLGLLPRVPFILGPRGELSPGALILKATKKSAFLRVAVAAGLFAGVRWQASTEPERGEIVESLIRHGARLANVDVVVACDVAAPASACTASRTAKRAGAARFLFVSRISPTKGLDRVIELVRSLRGEIELDIVGPVDDARYWDRCRGAIATLPANVRVAWHGPVEHRAVAAIFASHDLFVIPTLGENFGHVIGESLRAGCPVAVSDRTPWTHLSGRGAGWVLPLEDVRGWREALQACVDVDEPAHATMRERAATTRPPGDATALAQNIAMFRDAFAASRRWQGRPSSDEES